MAGANLFVGLYGERYGWCSSPDSKDTESNELLKRTFDKASLDFPWIEAYRDRSITEVEMRMIVEEIHSIPSVFLLRDKTFINKIDPRDKHIYQLEVIILEINSI